LPYALGNSTIYNITYMNTIRKTIIASGDIIMVIVSFCITLFIGFGKNISNEILTDHLIPFAALYVIWFIVLFIFDFYEPEQMRPRLNNITRLGFAFATLLVIGIIFFYATPIFDITPKTNLFINVAIFSVLFLIWRRFASALLASSMVRYAAIIGNEKYTDALSKILGDKNLGHKIVFQSEILTDVSLLPKKTDVVIIDTSSQLSDEVLAFLYNNNIEVIDIGNAYENIAQRIPVETMNNLWLVHNLSAKRSVVYHLFQRLISVCFAAVIILVFSPIMFFIAMGIKLQDGGPIFFNHERIGKNKKVFTLFKFRSMIENAEKNGAEWMQSGNDSRVTSFGKFLRASHMDEIPQMFNILRGDINLVGPRPERPEFVEKLENQIPHYNLRHMITPGFTGWAQIKFRYARTIMDSKEKFEYDLYYIKNANAILDIGIILKTIQIVVTHAE